MNSWITRGNFWTGKAESLAILINACILNINKDNIPERMFNSLNNGSALTFFTKRKAFIDSRGNNSAFLREYKSLQIPFETNQKYFSLIIDKYKLDAFLININNNDIIRRLYLDGRFVLVYLDETVALLVKDGIDKEKINNLRKTDWDKWVQNKIDDIHTEKGMHTKNTFYIDAGWVFLSLERIYLAKKLFFASLWINPNDMFCYYNLGLCFLKERDYKSAYEYLYKAYKLNPSDARTTISLFIVSKYLPKKEIAEYLSDIIKKRIPRETIENFEKIYEFIDMDTTFIKGLESIAY